MAPRKAAKKQPKQARPRQQTPERTPSPPPSRSRDPEPAYRSLRAVNELRDVLGDESDDSAAVAGSEMESYRDNTSQSRPNFSFLPSHKHSSPNHPSSKQGGSKDQHPPENRVHRLASMSTVPNTGLEFEATESPSTSQRRPPTRNERDEASSLVSSTVFSTGRNQKDTKPSAKERKPSRNNRDQSPSSSSSSSSQSSSSSSNAPSATHQQQQQPARSQGRKQKNPKNMHVLKEIHRLQGTVNNLIPKLSFGRLIREVLSDYTHSQMRVTVKMLQCLQEAAEVYVQQVFSDSYRCTLHRGRVTLMPKDMQLALMLRGD